MPALLFSERRRGFTLVELLVVIAILGLLSAIVLPNISGSVDSRRYRDAALDVSAFIARCHSRAIGSRGPKGLMMQPLSANTAASVDLFFADAPDVYAGETSAATATIASGQNLTTGPLTVTFDLATQSRLSQSGFCVAGDAIQFGTGGSLFKFLPPNQITMWFEDNQNIRNTAWPRAAAGLPFKIWRQPTRGTGGSLQLQKGACIDLAWSCLGTTPFSAFMGTNIPDNSISIMFDASGKPMEIVHSGGARTSIGSPVFLLVGDGALAGNAYDSAVSRDTTTARPDERGGANWQYGDCIWVCIDNNSGVVKTGPVAAGTTTVLASQRNVRLTIGYGTAEK
jgi:prepilin-type N-terminal cleavage/methylation domain-containing protein